MKTDSFFPLPSSCVTFDDTIHSNVLSVGYFKGILIKNFICKFIAQSLQFMNPTR